MGERTRVAILGATGHVAKCLTSGLWGNPAVEMTLVARDLASLDAFVKTLPEVPGRQGPAAPGKIAFNDFAAGGYDAIVNCVGFGNPATLATAPKETVFALTERFDRVVFDYLDGSPDTRCISLSSGAAYGGGFEKPASDGSCSVYPVNRLTAQDFYGLAKLASEARHREMSGSAIVDLRLFGLYSRFIDPRARYFMNDVHRALVSGETITVGSEEIWRDYVDPADLSALVLAVLNSSPRNDVFDVYSAAPTTKFGVLQDFAERYGLAYDVDEDREDVSPTGTKFHYYSVGRRAAEIGYAPRLTAIETLRSETDARLAQQAGERASTGSR